MGKCSYRLAICHLNTLSCIKEESFVLLKLNQIKLTCVVLPDLMITSNARRCNSVTTLIMLMRILSSSLKAAAGITTVPITIIATVHRIFRMIISMPVYNRLKLIGESKVLFWELKPENRNIILLLKKMC